MQTARRRGESHWSWALSKGWVYEGVQPKSQCVQDCYPTILARRAKHSSRVSHMLMERETERNELRAELRYVVAQQAMRSLTIEPAAAMAQMLAVMKETLHSEDVKPRRALLSKLVAWGELGKETGTIAYTFPLRV